MKISDDPKTQDQVARILLIRELQRVHDAMGNKIVPTGLDRFIPGKTQPGELYLDARSGETWQVIGYILEPAAILQNPRTGEQYIEVIGCDADKQRWRKI